MLHIDLEDCHIGMFDIKMCQRVIHLCRAQDNPIINDYRQKEYGYSKSSERPVFTRGYNTRKRPNK